MASVEETKSAKESENRADFIGIKGLHLDLCRHFLSCGTVLKIVSLLQTLKFNTLHLHLSDDQSIAIQSTRYPQIKFEHMLTIDEQETIADACQSAGIDIIPEIDIPGHTSAFLHIFRPDVPREKRLGIVTHSYIDIDRDLPIVLSLFEELAARFKAKYIHMGGDEARGFTDFPKLLTQVCAWASERSLKVIAWDEVANYFKELGKAPANLIVHRWRRRSSEDSSSVPSILSQGYYLDHVDDPLVYYERSPQAFGPNLGCIACTWTELIDENNIWCTILPTLFMLSLRWNEFPNKREHLPIVLYEQCEKYGYSHRVQSCHFPIPLFPLSSLFLQKSYPFLYFFVYIASFLSYCNHLSE